MVTDMPKPSRNSWVNMGSFRCDGKCDFMKDHPNKNLTSPDHQVVSEDVDDEQYTQVLEAPDDDSDVLPGTSKRQTSGVFTFARPVDYYSKVLNLLTGLGTTDTMLIIQTTGCPSCALAGVRP